MLALSPRTSPSTGGSGCCPHGERWRFGFPHAAQHTDPTSHRLNLWWLCPWQSGPQPPAGGCARPPKHVRTCRKTRSCMNKIKLPFKQIGISFQDMCLLVANMLRQDWVSLPESSPVSLGHSLLKLFITLGRGERSCATCRSATRGTVRRLGRTRKEAIASIIIVSDIALQMNASMMLGTHRGKTHTNTQTEATLLLTAWTCIKNVTPRSQNQLGAPIG